MRFLKRLLLLAIVLLVVLLAVSIKSGGKRFRQFGLSVQSESYKAGRKADKVKAVAGGIEAGVKSFFSKGELFIKRIKGKRKQKKSQ